MDYNVHKVCRVCLEEGALTSIYSTEFALMPSTMLMMCAKIRVYKTDGLPAVICNNCIYRLGVAYHFKQECENSDVRLRQYLNLDRGYGFCDASTNTESSMVPASKKVHSDTDQEGDTQAPPMKSKRRSRYQCKPPEEHKKRGPKPLPKLPQTCYECNKTFKCSAQLQMHMRTHSGEKPFACSYCPRKFAQKYNLLIHERTHTKEKPFQCEICSKQFAALGNFQAHQKIHTGVRDHLCPMCQKAFYSAGDLNKHMITHAGIKNHHCDICGKAFSRQRDMQMHKRKLHALHGQRSEEDDEDETIDADQIVVGGAGGAGGGVVGVVDAFKCPDCNKEFASAGSLSVHFRTHGSNNLLNLPLGCSQMAPPPPPPPPHPHYGHHPHDSLHAHHLSLNGAMQTNQLSAGGMAMATHPHMLGHPPPIPPPPPPPTPSGQGATIMMQRLHPY